MTTILDQAGPSALDFTDPVVCAAVLDNAAWLIATHGKADGEWWIPKARPIAPDGFPSLAPVDYTPGCPTCAVAAIAVALGYTTNHDVFTLVCGLDDEDESDEGRRPPHPVVREVMKALTCTKVERVFEWSDEATAEQVVTCFREIAAQLRRRAA